MSDELMSDDSKDSKVEKKVSFMAFHTSMKDVGVSDDKPPMLIESYDKGSLSDFDEELDL